MQHTQRRTFRGGFLLFFSTCIMAMLFTRLYINIKPALEQAKNEMAAGKTININSKFNSSLILQSIEDGNYFSDAGDSKLLADSLEKQLTQKGNIDNLGALNKKPFGILAPLAWQSPIGGKDFQQRLIASRISLGFDSALYMQELSHPSPMPAAVLVSNLGKANISGKVTYKHLPMPNVLVQLQQHIAGNDADPPPLYYVRTAADGSFSFTGLTKDSGYSVLPLKPGFDFGSRQGAAEISRNISTTFSANPQLMRLIGSTIFSQLKEDKLFVVRTPQAFERDYWLVFIVFIAAFWLLHSVWLLLKFKTDIFLLPILLLLTGISLLTLFDIQDPLLDTPFAWQTMQGVVVGLFCMLLVSQINFGKFYTCWWFDAFFNFRKKNTYHLSGFSWLLLAIGLALITLFFGRGPQGSGVIVNLQLGGLVFQPSEITRYLLLFFLAAFFAAREEKLRNFSDIRWHFLTNWSVMAGTAILLLLYLLMGDMGPAMVLCFTFLFFYSIARGNLIYTLAIGIIYAILLWNLAFYLATGLAFFAAFVLVFISKKVRSAKWYGWLALLAEAPMVLLLVMAAFAFGDKIPVVGERLASRKDMWLHPWNNDVYGGDHLAHAYWTLTSGGFFGVGLGKGYAKTMPAAHTDMILPSIGESLGWLGLVTIFLLIAVLIHRSFLHARRAGQPFLFYLCSGIAIATGVQFFLIAGGSIGIIPLTGVTVPLLSYGKVSLIINLAAMGILAGIAAREAEQIQHDYIQTHYDPVLFAGSLSFFCGIFIMAGILAWFQIFNQKKLIAHAARVVNRNGEPVFSYNPRIDRLTRLLGAGNIYDRNNLLLATENRAVMEKQIPVLISAGLNKTRVEQLIHKRLRRYYPFEENMFFWTGDYNTRLFWGQRNGYYAETAHLSDLRGFNTNPAKQQFITSQFKQDRFTKPVKKTVDLVAYDYSELTEMLRNGIDTASTQIKMLRTKNRDVKLAVDAALQTQIQYVLDTCRFSDKRISVLVIDAANGDVLASAMHPLPNLQAPELMALPWSQKIKLPFKVTETDLGMCFATAPGSSVKILTAMAAFNKLDTVAAEKKYTDIGFSEIIRKGNIESEPYNPRWAFIDMQEAIINSSNVFFIRMANEFELDNQLSDLYLASGMKVGYKGGYSYFNSSSENKKNEIKKYWKDSVFSINRRFYHLKRLMGSRDRYNGEFSGVAWGQGQLTATPISLARIAGAIANNGIMQPSRYVLEKGGKVQPNAIGIKLAQKPVYAQKLKDFMILQSNPPGKKQKIDSARVAGKTGTPQRVIKGEKLNDGWYVFFTPQADRNTYTVVCIRIEEGEASGNAVKLANIISPVLQQNGYLGSF